MSTEGVGETWGAASPGWRGMDPRLLATEDLLREFVALHGTACACNLCQRATTYLAERMAARLNPP